LLAFLFCKNPVKSAIRQKGWSKRNPNCAFGLQGRFATYERSKNKGINYGFIFRYLINGKEHPVRDASLTGCRTGCIDCSTERCIPNGMP
jgi:hypothetical protein